MHHDDLIAHLQPAPNQFKIQAAGGGAGLLPQQRQAVLADFARFLLARQDDEAWEQRLADPKCRPRLDAFLRDSAAEGDEPLDPKRL